MFDAHAREVGELEHGGGAVFEGGEERREAVELHEGGGAVHAVLRGGFEGDVLRGLFADFDLEVELAGLGGGDQLVVAGDAEDAGAVDFREAVHFLACKGDGAVRHARVRIFRTASKTDAIGHGLVPTKREGDGIRKFDPRDLASELAVLQRQLERGRVEADFGDGVQHGFQLLRIGGFEGEFRIGGIGGHLEECAFFGGDYGRAVEDRRDVADGVGGARAVAPDAVHHGVQLFDAEADEADKSLRRRVIRSAHTA